MGAWGHEVGVDQVGICHMNSETFYLEVVVVVSSRREVVSECPCEGVGVEASQGVVFCPVEGEVCRDLTESHDSHPP